MISGTQTAAETIGARANLRGPDNLDQPTGGLAFGEPCRWEDGVP